MTKLVPLHDVNVTSQKGRRFIIDITEPNGGTFETTLTVIDNITSGPVSVRSGVLASGPSAGACFEAALQHTQDYLQAVDTDDSIVEVHNPCNCPFVSQSEQERIAKAMGVTAAIRVN